MKNARRLLLANMPALVAGMLALDREELMPPKGFRVLPRRWVVERTFAWTDHNRRMSLGITRG